MCSGVGGVTHPVLYPPMILVWMLRDTKNAVCRLDSVFLERATCKGCGIDNCVFFPLITTSCNIVLSFYADGFAVK